MDYTLMTIEQLVNENIKLSNLKEAIRIEQQKIKAELDSKIALKSAQAKLATLSLVEKNALAQAIKTNGIKSEESVN